MSRIPEPDSPTRLYHLPDPIADVVREEGGAVTFARFMELALTHPEAGYYAQREHVFGPKGDFTTAPRLVPAFNRAVAHLVAQIVDALPDAPVIVADVGAGEGDLAAGMLDCWSAERPDLRGRVSVRTVDVSAGLRARQWQALGAYGGWGWDVDAVPDLGRLGHRASGDVPATVIVLGNELLDALPIHRVEVRSPEPREAWVRLVAAERATAREAPSRGARARGQTACVSAVIEEWGELSPEAEAELEALFGGCDVDRVRPLSRDGCVELRPAVRGFLATWRSSWPDLCVVTIDYGDRLAGPGEAGGRPHGRTLRGYYRHHVSADPYQAVGRQDLTADVDFRALDLHGRSLGLECVLFATLSAFLRGMGASREMEALAAAAMESLDHDRAASALGALLDDGGVGGEFKVMVQVGERPAGSGSGRSRAPDEIAR